VAKHSFRERRAADVAKTYKQNFQLRWSHLYLSLMKRLLPVIALLSCTPSADRTTTATLCETPQRIAALPRELNEASGLAVSRRNPGILWVHNDDGAPILFALDTLGNLRARLRILGVDNDDWEDIAVAPCGNAFCLYVGAIGDNRQKGTNRAIYIVPEPLLTDSTARPRATVRYRFPDQPHDTEALFVINEKIYLITKGRSGPITLFAVPDAAAEQRVTLRPLQMLTDGLVQLPDMVTAAAAAPDQKHVLVRTYSAFQIYTFENERLEPMTETTGYDLQNLNEFQGEGADITGNGVIYLVSEKGLEDKAPPLSKVVCNLSAN
jgi:hypothetical protein